MKSVNDIVKLTGLSRQRINQLIEDGQIKATLFGRKMYMIEDCDFDDFMKKRLEHFLEKDIDLRFKKV